MDVIVFTSLSGVVALASLFLVFSRDMRCSLLAFLVVNFILGVIFILENSAFLGFVLMLINIGAVFILFVFAMIMVNLPESPGKGNDGVYMVLASLLCGGLLFLIFRVVGFSSAIKHSDGFDFAAVARNLFYERPAMTIMVGFILFVVSAAVGILLFVENKPSKMPEAKIELKPHISIKEGGER